MELVVSGGDVVTMDDDRAVLVGGAVAMGGGQDRSRSARPTTSAGASRAQSVLDATGCVVTPGLVNAHHHLTGDPLVRSCIPDLLPPGASIFQWSVPLHGAHTPDDDELSATLSAVESLRYGTTTVVEAGTVAHPDRVAKAMESVGIRGTIGTWGWDIEVGPYTAPDRRGAGQAGGGGAGLPRGRPRGGLGDARRPRPGVRRAAGGRRRPGPTARDGHDDAPLAHLVGPGRLPGPHRPAAGHPPRASSACSGRTCCWPTACGSTMRRSTLSSPAAPPSPTARGPTCASARASPWPGATPTWSSAAAGWRSDATRPTPAICPTSSGSRRWRPGWPATRGSIPSASAPTPRSRWPQSPGPKPSAWATASARSRPASCADLVVHDGTRRGLDARR